MNETLEIVIKFDGIILDYEHHKLLSSGKIYDLTDIEVRLLRTLMTSYPIAVTRETLVATGWQTDYTDNTDLLSKQIGRLRQKLISNQNWEIETVRALGYRLRRRGVS
jgi:DNA-binding response OmpR family regulator